MADSGYAGAFDAYLKNKKKKDESDNPDAVAPVSISDSSKPRVKGNYAGAFDSYASKFQKDNEEQIKKQKEAEEKRKQEEASAKKEQERIKNRNWFEKGIDGVKEAFTTNLGKNLAQGAAGTADLAKSVFVDPAVKLYQQSQISSQIQSKNNGQAVVGNKFAKNQNAEIDRALKAGEIDKKRADELRAKTAKAVTTTKESVKSAEKNVGAKYNQDEGALALIDTAANLTGVGGIIKGAAKLGTDVGTTIISKMASKKAVDNVVDDITPKLPDAPIETQALKAETIESPKVAETVVPKRSDNYLPDTNKPRITQKEAEQKLVKAGYTTDESKKILEDVLPEKGLSMPGSPKKIGYNENKILEAANQFDKTPPLDGTGANKLVDETAAEYKSVDDYISQAVDRTWKDNKKGAGTNVIYKHENDIGTGSDSLQGTRISENNPYYRAVFEETGKAPTKAKIAQDITDFLNGADNSARHLLDPEERGVVDLIREREAANAIKNEVPEGAISPDGSNITPLASKDGTAQVGTSKLGASVKDTALHDRLIKKTEADTTDLPTYNKADMKQQAQYATDLIKSAPQDALDIAMGRKSPPEHILQQMVFNAVEDHAKKIGGDKGAQLLLDLSRSRQSGNLTKMGQEIRAAAERDPHSPVTLMNEVKLARAEAAKARGKDLTKALKADADEIKKATPKVKKEDWESFIKGLEC